MPLREAFLLAAAAAALCAAADSRFEPAASCALCHARIAPPGKPDAPSVAPFALWSGSMMANAARDPFWKAKVRYESAAIPAASALIEDKCLRCHAPAQQYESGGLRLDALNDIGREGVVCTVCHQIEAGRLGTRASFTGGFTVNADRNIFGPHPNPFPMPMLHHSGYFPKEGRHILESSLCGTCHTVITPTLTADGRVAGEFIEQSPYLEWLASDFPKAGATCQSCHAPLLRDASGAPAAQYIAHMPRGDGAFPPTRPRTPFGQHSFAGANTRMLALLENPGAARAQAMLESALDLGVEATAAAGRLEVAVEVRNRTGHKLPTGFPSRRLWLRVRVSDASGTTVFESGAGDAPPAGQPHYAEITRPEQVQIYESAMLDPEGRPTVQLMRAARFGKDNRILPRGFDAARRLTGDLTAAAIAPAGAGGDPDFRPGSDRVLYRIRPGAARGPFRVRVEACYQGAGPEHARPLGEEFARQYGRLRAPVMVAWKEMSLPATR